MTHEAITRSPIEYNPRTVAHFQAAWERYIRYLQRMPKNVRHSIERLIERRQLAVSGIPAGLLLASWFAESLDIEFTGKFAEEITLGHIFLYIYVVLKDDLLDKDEVQADCGPSIAVDLHLLRATQILGEASSEFNDFHVSFEKLANDWLLYDAKLISQYERNWASTLQPDSIAYAKKCAILKGSGVAMAYTTGDWERWESVNKAFDLLTSGDVFLDDLKDWQTDIKGGQVTYLLSKALRFLNVRELPKYQSEEFIESVGTALYTSSAAIDNLERAEDCLTEALNRFNQVDARQFSAFTGSLLSAAQDLRQLIASAGNEIGPSRARDLNEYANRIFAKT